MAERICRHEKYGCRIALSQKGRHAKVLCMLEDPALRNVINECIYSTGKLVRFQV